MDTGNLLHRRTPNNYVDIQLSGRGEHFPVLKYGLHIVTFFQRRQDGRESKE